jgi:HAD superfamily hydrolase (TIGR01549 family)
MIRGIIFDLGSTLIRFNGEWGDVVSQAHLALVDQLQRDGLKIDGAAVATDFRRQMEIYYHERESDFIEVTTAFVLRAVLAEFGHHEVSDDVIRRALERMYRLTENHWSSMPGVQQVLDVLGRDGYRLGMISNAGNEANVHRLIDNAGLRRHFDPILISAAVGLRKPNPALFEMVLQAWRLPPHEVVMIGDTLGADILGAQNAGIHQIWLTADADTPSNRAHAGTIIPEAVASSLAEVPSVLKGLARAPAPISTDV